MMTWRKRWRSFAKEKNVPESDTMILLLTVAAQKRNCQILRDAVPNPFA